VIALEVLLGIDRVFAVEHRHGPSLLQAGGAVGDRQEVAGRIGSKDRHGSGQHGNKSQQGRNPHRAGSFKGEIGMTLSSSLGGKTELAFFNDGYRLNEW
jgi:hypothetical protein